MSDNSRPPQTFLAETGSENVISRNERRSPTGGARRDRTDDLLLAKQALSQLSYGPFRVQSSEVRDQHPETKIASNY
jgi:hypothetical protein